MTQAERLTLDGLNDHVIELKGDVGELKADVRTIKDALEHRQDDRRHWNVMVFTCLSAILGAASLAGLEKWLLRS